MSPVHSDQFMKWTTSKMLDCQMWCYCTSLLHRHCFNPPDWLLFIQDLVMDILRVLSTPDLEVRKKTLQLALDLVSSRNVEEVSHSVSMFLLILINISISKGGEKRSCAVNLTRFFCPCSWWLFWKRRWSRQTTSQNTKTLISTGSCWCALSTLAVCVSLTWRPTSFLWWVIHHC